MNRIEIDLVDEILNRIEKDLIDEIRLLNERVDKLSISLRVLGVIGAFITITLIAILEKGGLF